MFDPLNFGSASFIAGTEPAPCKSDGYRPCIVANDVISFMIPADYVADYSTYNVGLVSDFDSTMYVAGVAISTINNIDGTFTYYASITMPALPLEQGNYYLAVYNPVGSQVVLQSKALKPVDNTDYVYETKVIEYRNESNIGGFRFVEVPAFKQKLRLDINQSTIRYSTEKSVYREQTTDIRRLVNSISDKYRVFKTFQFSEAMHDAIMLAFDCGTILLDGVQYSSVSGSYSPNLEEDYYLSNGEIELYLVGFSYSSICP